MESLKCMSGSPKASHGESVDFMPKLSYKQYTWEHTIQHFVQVLNGRYVYGTPLCML